MVIKTDTQPGRSISTERLGPALREWRKRRRFSQEGLASKIGSTGQKMVVSRIELGRIKISFQDVEVLAKALEIPTDYLIKGVFPWDDPDTPTPTSNDNLGLLSTPELFKLLRRALDEIERRSP